MDIIILEDDKSQAQSIRKIIGLSLPNMNIALVTDSLNDVLEYVMQAVNPAIFILDIVIHNSFAGLTSGKKIFEASKESKVIYISNYPKIILHNPFYKIKAYSIIFKHQNGFNDELTFTLRESIKELSENQLIVYNDRFNYISIGIEGIILIEKQKYNRKICIYHENGTYQLNMTLLSIMDSINNTHFVRCHNAFIINTNKIRYIDKKNKTIFLHQDKQCTYSYIKGKKLMEKIKGVQ